jgi:hypothetical protein
MDERAIVQSAISHINAAISDIDNFPRSGMNKKGLNELDLTCNSLKDSIRHCNAIFGPATVQK